MNGIKTCVSRNGRPKRFDDNGDFRLTIVQILLVLIGQIVILQLTKLVEHAIRKYLCQFRGRKQTISVNNGDQTS